MLYVRNLMLSSTEARIEEAFSKFAPVERVKKIRDYAFVHFHTRDGALSAMENLNGECLHGVEQRTMLLYPLLYSYFAGTSLDGAVIEVTLAKPVDKDNYPRSPRHGQQYGLPGTAVRFVDCSQLVPTIYPGYYPKYE